MLSSLIVVLHVIVCISMVLVVLLQSGKGANMGAAFGGSSQTIFGSSGPGTFLGKATTLVAVVFMLTSLWLAYFAAHKSESIIRGPAPPSAVERTIDEGAPPPAAPEVPAQPVPAPAPAAD